MDQSEIKGLKDKRKLNRQKLFKSSRPNIREFEGLDDLLWLWTSYRIENPKSEMTETQFIDEFSKRFITYDFVYVVEDNNEKLPENHGIVAFVYGLVDDRSWKHEPHVHYLNWSTKRNILRTTVAYLQKMRFSKKVGFISIFSEDKNKNLFDRVWDYVDLRKVKSMAGFYPDSSVNIYLLRGGKKNG